MDFVLSFEEHFLLSALAAADGFINDTGGFSLSRADLTLGDLLTISHTDDKTGCNAHYGSHNNQNNS